MTSQQTIKMPKRFDYSASTAFNSSFVSLLNSSGGLKKEILLDCSDLEYLDSAGIGLLVMAHKKASSGNAAIVITNIRQSARDILMLANLQKLIEFR